MKTIQQAVTDYVSENNTTKDAFIEELGFGRSAFFMKMRGETELTLPSTSGIYFIRVKQGDECSSHKVLIF